MAGEIHITKDFFPAREKAVLLELLNIMRALKEENIDAIVCGGWVPFLKELARDSETSHSMSFDIDVLLRAKAREREAVDRIKALLAKSLAYEPNKDVSFRYEKKVDGNIVQLDLLTDLPRIKEDESILKVYGAKSSLDLCLVDGAEDLKDHVEILGINVRDGDKVESFEINVPDAVGFLLLKTAVGHFREEPKDAYDLYYYCRYSEDPVVIRGMLAKALHEPAIARTVQDLRTKFTHGDSKWAEMVLDEMSLQADDRDREAQFVVRSIGRAIEGL
jgi:hypothetical protein